MAEPQNRSAAFAELERGVFGALGTYANVHRGSGHNAMVTTALFEQARGIVLNDLQLNDGRDGRIHGAGDEEGVLPASGTAA